MDKNKVASELLKLAKELVSEKKYQEFFQKKLDKYGVNSPDELSDEKKKQFFNEVDKEWVGEDEKSESKTAGAVAKYPSVDSMIKDLDTMGESLDVWIIDYEEEGGYKKQRIQDD